MGSDPATVASDLLGKDTEYASTTKHVAISNGQSGSCDRPTEQDIKSHFYRTPAPGGYRKLGSRQLILSRVTGSQNGKEFSSVAQLG